MRRPPEELFDLETDPQEVTNLAQDPDQADRLASFRARMEAWQRDTRDPWAVSRRGFPSWRWSIICPTGCTCPNGSISTPTAPVTGNPRR